MDIILSGHPMYSGGAVWAARLKEENYEKEDLMKPCVRD